MNYYAARQGDDDKKWDYTCMNDGRMWPIGYCSRFLEAEVGGFAGCTQERADRHNNFREKYGRHNHETKEEAFECYKQYVLDNLVRFWPYREPKEEKPMTRTEHLCQAEGCESYKAGLARMEQRNFFLCDEHQTRAVVSSLLHIGESWSSY